MMKKISAAIIIMIMTCLLAGAGIVQAAGVTITGDDTGITLSGAGPLFDLKHMAPGDSDSAEMIVKNTGKDAFSLAIKAEKDGGDTAFYNCLRIKIQNADKSYSFDDLLKNLTNVSLGQTAPGTESKYTVTISLPEGIGNEYQTKNASFSFIFSATGSGETVMPTIDVPGGSILPQTGGIMGAALLGLGTVLLGSGLFILIYPAIKKLLGSRQH